jgi:hypothetical protein
MKDSVGRVLVGALLAAGLFLPACGGGNGGNGGPTGPTPQNPQDPTLQTINGTVPSFGTNEHALSVSRTGNLTVTLTWQGPADLDLYLTSSDCGSVYGDNACPRLVVSDQLVGNSESVTRAVQSGDRFKIWVDNFTLAAQPYTVQIDVR